MAESTLVTVEKTDIPSVFKQGGTDALVQIVKDHVKDLVPDTSTLKGRKEIASLASKVAKSKTYLDGIGKDYVAELKAIPKAVDAERKRMRDTLDDLKETVRKPLTEWEEAENARVMRHEANLTAIIESGTWATNHWMDMNIEAMVDLVVEYETEAITGSWEEYASDAGKAKDVAISALTEAIEKRQAYDAEQAELAELRKLQAEQEQKDRDDALRREGEERAKREAEEAVQAGIVAKENAERRAKEADERAADQAIAAAKQERERIEAEQNAEKEAAANRERNTQHKGRINRAVVSALMEETGITEIQAKAVVSSIAKGRITHVEISY